MAGGAAPMAGGGGTTYDLIQHRPGSALGLLQGEIHLFPPKNNRMQSMLFILLESFLIDLHAQLFFSLLGG
jgi:hypothetical protein